MFSKDLVWWKSEVVFLILFSVIAVYTLQVVKETPAPEYDSLRYIDYSLSLYKHNIFGLAKADFSHLPEPGSANVPLYPLFIYGIINLDSDLYDSLNCFLINNKNNNSCSVALQTIVFFQNLLICLALLMIWLASRVLFQNSVVAWFSVIFMLLSGLPHYYSNRILTEILVIFFYSGLFLSLVLSLKHGQLRWWMLMSLFIALLTLTRPEYLYLFCVTILFIIGYTFLYKRKDCVKIILSVAVIYILCISPWLSRNYFQFNKVFITEGYSSEILVQRVAYNEMSLKEWGISFIYWFPDFGDSLAIRLFNKSSYERLGFGSGSFYEYGNTVLREKIRNEVTKDEMTGYLLKNEILAYPAKHLMVTTVLLWRAMFIGKYWGIFGAFCFIVCLVQTLRNKKFNFLLVSLPAWFMAILYASISVSITRYNLGLLFIYSMSMAWCTDRIFLYFNQKRSLIND